MSVGIAHANGVGNVLRNDGRGSRFAFQHRTGVDSHFFGSETGSCRDGRVNAKNGGRTADGVFDSVAHVHYPADVVNGIADLRCPLFQQSSVRREQFDLHGFRRVRQIANHVLQHLYVLYFQPRFLLFDLRPNLRNDFVAAAVTLALQLYGNIAAIGFSHGGQTQFQSGATRCALDLRSVPQYLLDVADHEFLVVSEITARWGLSVRAANEILAESRSPGES